MKLPKSREKTLINIVMKWKWKDAWNKGRKERYENTRAWRINKQILIEENIIDEFNRMWETEKDVYKTQLRETRRRKMGFLHEKFGQQEKHDERMIEGITIADREIPQGFSSSSRKYGNTEITTNEREVLSLPTKFAVYDQVDLTECEAEVEKGLKKLRWAVQRSEEQENGEQEGYRRWTKRMGT